MRTGLDLPRAYEKPERDGPPARPARPDRRPVGARLREVLPLDPPAQREQTETEKDRPGQPKQRLQ
jgi:hypothetical protein